jgi:hypothetical protein
MRPSLSEDGALDSLVIKLKLIRLRLRAGDGADGSAALEVKDGDDDEAMAELSNRGIVLESELAEGGDAQLRIGQCWKFGDRLIEVMAFNGPNVEFIEWETQGPEDPPKQGGLVYVSPRDDYYGYPTGMGSRQMINMESLRSGSTHLVELGADWFGVLGGAQALQSRIMGIKAKKLALVDQP